MRQLHISELRRGDVFYDMDGGYKVYSDPVQVNGEWTVSTTDDGDFEVNFKEAAVIWTHPPEGSLYDVWDLELKQSRFKDE